ncbi:MOSC domain-containing protein [Escherichia coli]|nr:MOSC domain-containing protein [Escherichia coli]
MNKRLTEPVPMERFRPNLVFSGGEPFCEDNWSRIRIGEVVFRVVKPCERCVITTIDQNSGKPSGPEPLRTLATFRRSAGGTVLFGQNMIAENPGPVIKIGDEVEILEYRDRD